MKLATLLIAFLLIPVAFAAKFDNYDISYDANNLRVSIESTIILDTEVAGLDFSVFNEPKNLKVSSSVPIEYRLEEIGGYKIVIDFLQPLSGNITLSINFTSDLTEVLSDRKLFTMAFQAPLDIDKFSLRLMLPQSSQIYYQNNQPLVTPRANIQTDGKRIILLWEDNIRRGDSFVAVASFTKPEKPFPAFITSMVTLGILVLSTFLIWTHFKKKSHKPIITAMSEDEKEIFHLIKAHKGITQEDIREKTGYSKSKISKLIRNLEKMDVIKKSPYKKTNKLESKL